jgi:hypothetical protein
LFGIQHTAYTTAYYKFLGKKCRIFKPPSGHFIRIFSKNFNNKQVGGLTLFKIYNVHPNSNQEVPEEE